MAYAAHRGHFAPDFIHTPSSNGHAIAKKPGVLWRIFDAIVESRQKSADREIALRLDRSGGRITDSFEREMIQSLMTGNWKVRD
jgi:hypothetical protein